MPDFGSTIKDGRGPSSDRGAQSERRPGLALLFSCGQPAAVAIPLAGGPVELGRGSHGPTADPRMSRRHARVSFDGNRFWVTDLGSQNGTSCDGRAIPTNQSTEVQRLLRMGDSLFGVFRDIQPMVDKGVRVEGGLVLGPALQLLLNEVKQAARFGSSLHITGESGTGKELVAQTFHKHGPRRDGPFIPVNCAAIPQGLAERLLFGTRRGAYSGADANADGYIQAAAGGTLFLDEVGDLDLGVQAKLLRVLETKELFPLGAARPHTVDLHVCSATNKDLKAQAGAGRFREDLYYRIGRPLVTILPLRKRPEEIPWLVDTTVRQVSPAAVPHTSLVEVCLMRPWPGNIRELLVEVRSAARSAACQDSPRVEARHLPEGAGTALRSLPEQRPTEVSEPTPLPTSAARASDPAERQRIEAALRGNHGNVSSAARALGLHRTQLRRLLERYNLDPQRFAEAGQDEKVGIDYDEV
jgi:DNA-binding NtrC family response regulator